MVNLLTMATITPIFSIGAKKDDQSAQVTRDNQNKNPWVTIWIHGTRLTPKILFPKFFDVKPGLTKATHLDESYHHREIAQTLAKLDTERFKLDHFYLFGWSGKLSFKKRQDAARQLHTALTALITDYKNTHGITPRVRIITHSHGGNVALNLAQHASKNNAFEIEELILLACPVQEETQELIKHPLFKTVYSLYSKIDMLQIADPQGIYGLASEEDLFDRTWFSQRLFPVHPKLKQAEITYNGRGILHVEFLLIKKMAGFIEHLPAILQTLATNNESLQKIDLKG